MSNASEELSTELTISDLRNIARLIAAAKGKVVTDDNDIAVISEVEKKITDFLKTINETV